MDFDPVPFELRRKQFSERLGDGMAIIPAARETPRNDDVDHPFRQDSDFFFLTGFPEPDAVALIDPDHPVERYVLFVRPRDRDREIWDGKRAGPEGAVSAYGADAAYPLDELDARLREKVVGRSTLFYRPGNPTHDARVTRLLGVGRDRRTESGRTMPHRVEDPSPILGEMRLVKSSPEIERLRRACAISVDAHLEAMRYARPGLHEYQVGAAVEYVSRVAGSRRDGYPSIVASGPNACILHYVDNDRRMEDGDLLLLDAGCEYGHFSADITRTFPVNGRFTAAQRAIYEVVLAAQEAVLAICGPGARYTDLHDTARRVVAEGLVELGLVPRSVEDTLAFGHDREFFMHGTSHWLGMDVHDAGGYRIDGVGRPLEPGMAFTVEPGVYVDPQRTSVSFPLRPYDADADRERAFLLGAEEARQRIEAEKAEAGSIEHAVPEEFLGIGVRIEDDVIITGTGYENLTAGAPRSVEAIEAVCAEPSRLSVP